MRLTRQNECDVVLDPLTPNSRIQTAGFIMLSLSPDVEEGEDITTKNACGDICIRDKDCDRLKGFDIELTLCGVPPHVIELLTGATLLDDGSGNITGVVLKEAKDAACLNSIALELWSKNANARCDIQTGVENLFIHWVLPRTINWEISGGLEFSNAQLEIVLSGYAENNPNWFPSFPGVLFPSWVPGGGDPTGLPTGAPPPVLPAAATADTWSLADQAAIQAGGPLAWKCENTLPPTDDCAYFDSTPPIP
jgi:hypothetical protein